MRHLLLPLCALAVLVLYSCRSSGSYIVPERLKTTYPPLNNKLAGLVSADSLALSAREASRLTGAIFLDAREPEEYLTSHLPGAIFLGYNRPDYGILESLDRDTPLVVYCTVGYRSERIATALRERGFDQVYNLYGSLYAWKLSGLPLVNADGPTDRLHTYNRKWGTFIPDTLGIKVY